MTGTIVTFYSYKGGVGRTFALANTAAVLARWGYRTLCVDWDLDAPGLSYYFRPWLENDAPAAGLADLVTDYAEFRDPAPSDHVVPVAMPGTDGRLHLLAAGSDDDGYVRRVHALDWADLYENRDLGDFLERCREQWTTDYDVVLVDSRTGITDIGGICTAQLPDVLVMLFTANEQSLRGTLDVAERAFAAHDALPYDRAGLMIVPIPSRFDAHEEYKQADVWRGRFADALAPLVEPWAAQELPIERLLGHLTVPYISFWSFGEQLPAFEEEDIGPDKISYTLETLAALVAHRLDRTGLLAESRDSFIAAAARAARRAADGWDVFISVGLRDYGLAQQLAQRLVARSLRVFLPSRDLALGEIWSPIVEEAIAASANIVVLVGDGTGAQQLREIEKFLRQTLDERADRLVIPVLTPGTRSRDVPTVLAQYPAERLRKVDEAAVTALVHTIVRDVTAGTNRAPAAPAEDVRQDTVDTLTDITGWELDDLRWQLVGDGVEALTAALDGANDADVRAVAADLELLGPVRGSPTWGRTPVEMPTDLRQRVEGLIARLGGEIDLGDARAAVVARLDRFAAGESGALVEPAALEDAARYRRTADDADDDVAVAALLGRLHYARSTVVEDGATARREAVRHFATLFRVAPDRVPAELREEVADAAGDATEAELAVWSGRLLTLLEEGRTDAEDSVLDDAVWLAGLIVDHCPPESVARASYLVNQSTALRARFRQRREPADINRGVMAAAEAASGKAVGAEDSARSFTAWGLALVDRFEATAQAADLDLAIRRFVQALDFSDRDEPTPAGRHANLGAAMATRFRRTGDLADLDQAITLLDMAIRRAASTAERGAYHANLGAALLTRYGQIGAGDDLDGAVRHGRRGVAVLPPDDPGRVPALSGLGFALRSRYQRTGDRTDLDEAVDVLDEALRGARPGPEYKDMAAGLGSALRVRFDDFHDRADLERAVLLGESATAVPHSYTDHARHLNYLGTAHATRFRSAAGQADLEMAFVAYREALSIVDSKSSVAAAVRSNLGQTLAASGVRGDLLDAMAQFRAAAQVVNAAAWTRALAARQWGDIAAELGDLHEAMFAYRAALDRVGAVTDRRLALEDQLVPAAGLGGLGSAAAAIALELGEPLLALTLLEQGRGILLAQALETRGEPGDLRAAHPDLAERFDILRRRLGAPDGPQRRLVREWDDLLDEIRTRPGFARFLRPPDADDLLAAVGEGLLVAVNIARRCDALIVQAGTLTIVPLPDLTYDAVHERAISFLAGVQGDEPDAAVADALAWLRETIVSPILSDLALPERMWWMPTGPLTALPLAAAGHVDFGDVIASTTLTVRALREARRPAPVDSLGTLVAAMARTPGHRDLPSADAEAAEVAAAAEPPSRVLAGGEATTGAVLAGLADQSYTHFACHAVTDLAGPGRSGLVLVDGLLTVRKLAELDHDRAYQAYLSACRIAFGGGDLLDEAVSVASAFHLAGYRHVITALWPVGDLATRRFARLHYAALASGLDPAAAMHQAVRLTREALPDRPSVWAAYVHIGA